MYALKIDVYSHGLVVSEYNHKSREALYQFRRKFGQVGKEKIDGKWVWRMKRTFSGNFKNYQQFRFHADAYDLLIDHLAAFQIKREQINVVVHKVPPGVSIPEMRTRDSLIPFNYQVPLVSYLADTEYKGRGIAKKPTFLSRSKATTLQTGKGKTASALLAAAAIKKRVLLTMLAGFIPKWIGDVKDAFNLKKNEKIITVNGLSDFRTLIEMGKNNQIEDWFIFISNRSLLDFIKHYEETMGTLNFTVVHLMNSARSLA